MGENNPIFLYCDFKILIASLVLNAAHNCIIAHIFSLIFDPGAMNFFKKMNIGALEIGDYMGTTPFLFL